MNKQQNKVFCVISHTHWDREWYMPLEQFRHRLVDLMDHLLDTLAAQPSYIFHLDAQTVVLEDYLAVRPEKREQLRQFISRRRLMIGPFFLQNDFYLTSGEATVRNILEGQKLCREFGGSAKAGYAADQFGNASQLPQILRDFGFDNFIFGRGFSQRDIAADGTVTPKKTPTEFIWKGPDGSEVLAIHMRHWYNNAQRFSEDIEKATRFLRAMTAPYNDELTATPYILLMNGVDHLEAQAEIRDIIDKVQEKLDDGEYFVQYNMDDYVDAVKQYVEDNHVELQTVEGEMRVDSGLTTLQGTLSSRSYLKTANVRAQAMLENRLEPLYAMMERYGMKGVYPHDRLVYTWKNIIRNHPHDSICGCSTDAVHRHMENRYAEIFEFAEEQLRRAMLTATEHTAMARAAGDQDYIITVANTLSTPLRGAVEVQLKMLCSDDMENFRIVDGDGRDVEFIVVEKKRRSTAVYSAINLPGWVEVFDYTIQLDAGDVAPFAFKSFLVTAGESTPTVAAFDATLPTVIENDLLTVSVSADGRVDITDRKSGRTLKDCLRAEDREDNGDSYMFKPEGHAPLYSDDWAKTVTLTAHTALKQAVKIEYTMDLPLYYDEAANARSTEMATSKLTLELTLYRGRPFVEIDYTLDNASRDHHLALCVDTDIAPVESYADSMFDVVRRTGDMHYHTTPIKIDPNASFALLQENGRGVAVFTEGTHEYMHPEDKLNRLSFGLVRATGGILHDGHELWCTPENQCLRTMSGRLAVALFEGDFVAANIPAMSLAFRAPLLPFGTACDSRKFAGGRPCVQDTTLTEFFYFPDSYPDVAIADNTSAIDVVGDGVAFSAFKLCEDESGLILRLFNYTEEETTVTVKAVGDIFRTRMDEIARVFLGKNEATLTLRGKEIATLCLQ